MHRRLKILQASIVLLMAMFFADSVLASGDTIKPLQMPGVVNAFKVSDRIYSGSQPEGEEGFASLKKLGIKTIISVDGSKPDVEQAARFGLRYVHLPHGYDKIPTNTVLRLIKAVETLEGPFFVHCHHGKHRGPAAVAVICQGTEGWTPEQGLAWLHLAGTAAEYQGLFKTSAEFHPPPVEVLGRVSTNFPARVEVSGLVDAMVEIDQRWDHLQAIRKAGWKVPPDQPDLVPASEAVLLEEHFRELARTPEAAAKGKDFMEKLQQAEKRAAALRKFLTSPVDEKRLALGEELAKAAAQSCSTCHSKYRN